MAIRTLAENTAQAIADFKDIKQAIEESGAEVPDGTPTSEYSKKVLEVADALEYFLSDGYTDYRHYFASLICRDHTRYCDSEAGSNYYGT